MSPKELVLTFRNLDKLGHMMLEGQLGHYTYIRNQFYFQKVIFAFEFDPSLLPDVASQFSAFKIWS